MGFTPQQLWLGIFGIYLVCVCVCLLHTFVQYYVLCIHKTFVDKCRFDAKEFSADRVKYLGAWYGLSNDLFSYILSMFYFFI